MPIQKDLKRIVRARMQKTGESYTAARRHLVDKPIPPAAKCAEIAGMSNDAVRAKTGYTWRQWVEQLDLAKADRLPHREIARHVGASYDVSGWWAQTVTVAYERIRGLRQVGQRCDGKFDANKSKTFPVPLDRLYRGFSVKRTRDRWLPGETLKIRTSTVNKSMRITWTDGTSVHVYFTDKGPSKSQVAIQHAGLDSRAEIAKRKDYWSGRFSALAELLKV
ncbi:MAG: hypothetical protein GY716_09735 [bacterium]|nr:hypothetical protein [bacterium]